MRSLVICALVASLCGCSAENEVRAWRDKTCACSDMACVSRQTLAWQKLRKELSGKRGDQAAADRYYTEAVACMKAVAKLEAAQKNADKGTQ